MMEHLVCPRLQEVHKHLSDKRSPKAVYTHCNAHCLNLAIVHSCDIPVIRNMIGTLNEICSFFKFSPKRHELLAAVVNNICPNTCRSNLVFNVHCAFH